MIKAAALIKRKPGTTMRDFIEHYETSHAKIGEKYQTKMCRYVRHYLHPVPRPHDGLIEEPAYDVMTELWFESEQHYKEGMELMMAPEAQRLLTEDEARFMDVPKGRFCIIDERESELPARPSSDRPLKLYMMMRRKAGLTMDQFVSHYENNHQPLILSLGMPMRSYRRLYMKPVGYPITGEVVEPVYDVLTEITFNSAEDARSGNDNVSNGQIGDLVREDEDRFLDPVVRSMVRVEDHESKL